MKQAKQMNIEAKGWKVGSLADFLGLSSEEEAYIDMKLSLSVNLKQWRKHNHLTQLEFASLINSSQSRVAKMESGSESVSIDLLIKSLMSLGVSREDLGRVISGEL